MSKIQNTKYICINTLLCVLCSSAVYTNDVRIVLREELISESFIEILKQILQILGLLEKAAKSEL